MTALGFCAGLWEPLQTQMYSRPRSVFAIFGRLVKGLGEPSATLLATILAAGFADGVRETLKMREQKKANRGASSCGYNPRTDIYLMLYASAVRIVLIPSIGVLLLFLLRDVHVILPNDPLVRVIILLQFAAPSAMTVGMVCNQLEMTENSQFASIMLFINYLLSIITTTFFCSVAIALFT
eukprot:TRINITY_DN121729_c0_g1_i1.p1 TRINITY_DN121729_c0_g1~~TRINITY_DN121729_c0_g1_i1.p1  ORF type:complete len:190 (+),score=4.69 TRINITY_DN121729_c0_g1_i1:30-572(+)